MSPSLQLHHLYIAIYSSSCAVYTVVVNKRFTFRFHSTIVVRYAPYKKYRSHVVEMESENGNRTESLPFKRTWCVLSKRYSAHADAWKGDSIAFEERTASAMIERRRACQVQ